MTNTYYSVPPAGVAAEGPYQIPLFSSADEAELYHCNGSDGYFSLLVKRNGQMRQSSYPVKKMATVLDMVDVNMDTWISQAEFRSSLRRVVNVKSIGLGFLDIDYYKDSIDWGQGKSPERAADDFVWLCDDFGIPRPSFIVFSGRGLQVKWLFEKALPRMALPRWSAIEKVLIAKFSQYGADPMAKDAARVLRLVQTVNTKSKQFCRVVWVNGDDKNPLRYDFENFAECVLPVSRTVIREQRIAAASKAIKTDTSAVSRALTLETLNWHRVEDLRTLVRLRGGIAEGMRMNMLFYILNFLALSRQVTMATFYSEALVIAKEIDPLWTASSAELRTVYSKFKDYLAGKTVEFHGRVYPALYTPSNDTLINLFGITSDEQRQLKTIIDSTEQYRRKVETRRAGGMLSRFEYEDLAEQRALKVRLLSDRGLTMREIAEELSLSKSQIHRYLQGCS